MRLMSATSLAGPQTSRTLDPGRKLDSPNAKGVATPVTEHSACLAKPNGAGPPVHPPAWKTRASPARTQPDLSRLYSAASSLLTDLTRVPAGEASSSPPNTLAQYTTLTPAARHRNS